ncbi:MAG: response regulator transcription factor [Chloroflexi bacterium]|nr:response regulator transcription factor [Chloroflexota bacterium]
MTLARILLADDNELFREGLAKIINSQTDMEVVGQAEDGLEALTLVYELKPDLIVMDINMPLSDGLEATRLIRSSNPQARIIMLTAYEEEEKLFEAIKAGAQGYILKNSSAAGLLRGLRGALVGESTIPRKLATQVLAEFANLAKRPENNTNGETIPLLTRRESEILNIMATGVTNQEIAEKLSISLQTVKTHVSSILEKLQAKSRHHATELGLKQGLIRRKL